MECRLYSELPGLSCKNKGKLLPKKFTGKKVGDPVQAALLSLSILFPFPTLECQAIDAGLRIRHTLLTPFRHVRLHEPLAGLVPVPDDIVTAGVHRGQQFI